VCENRCGGHYSTPPVLVEDCNAEIVAGVLPFPAAGEQDTIFTVQTRLASPGANSIRLSTPQYSKSN
jgi:hypothetical protein